MSTGELKLGYLRSIDRVDGYATPADIPLQGVWSLPRGADRTLFVPGARLVWRERGKIIGRGVVLHEPVDLPWRWRDGGTKVWPYVIFLLDKQMI